MTTNFVGADLVNVRVYGATGNGTTDDTAAIQTAINKLAAAIWILPTGGTVYFPAGQYLVTSTITVPNNIRLVGAGRNNSRIVKGFNGDLLQLGNNAGIENMALWGDGGNFTGKGIFMTGSDGQQSCSNLEVINFADLCIYFRFGAGSQSSWHNIIAAQYNAVSGSGKYAIGIDHGAEGVVQSGATTTVVQANIGDTTHPTGWYNGCNFVMTTGPLAVLADIRVISNSVNNGGGLWTFTLSVALPSSPSAADSMEIFINSGVPRKFSHIECNGSPTFDLGASNDTYIIGSTVGDILYDQQTRGCHFVACRLFGGTPQHLQGFNNTIIACDVGPQLILDATAVSWTIGPNTYNNSPVINNSASTSNLIFDYSQNGNAPGYINVRSAGAQGDGTTDDTGAFLAAISEAASSHSMVLVPPGTYRITASLPLSTAPGIIGFGSAVSVIKVDAAVNALTTTTLTGRMQGLGFVDGPSGTHLYTAIKLFAASFWIIDDINIQNAQNPVVLFGQSYWNRITSLTATNFSLEGIHLVPDGSGNPPNNNQIAFNEISGPGAGVANSYGFIDEGLGNLWIGGEVANVLTPFKLTGSNATVQSIFAEACNNNFVVTDGTHQVSGRIGIFASPNISGTAKVFGPGGDLSGFQSMRQPRLSFFGCQGLWLFNENAGPAGVLFRDWSGNNRPATSGGSTPIWDFGEFSPNFRLDPLHGGNTAQLPLSAFNFSSIFTIAVLARIDDAFPAGGPYTNQMPVVTFRKDATNWVEVGYQPNGGVEVQQSVSGVTSQVSTVSQANAFASGKYFWLIVALDPVAHQVIFLDPWLGVSSQTLSLAGLSSITEIDLFQNPATFPGKGSIAYFGTWNRQLTLSEVSDLVNAKTPLVPEIPHGPFTVTATGASFTHTTPFDTIIYSTDDATRNFQLIGATPAGTRITVVDSSGSTNVTHTIAVFASSGTINGSSTYVITPGQYKSVTFVSDGTNYFVSAAAQADVNGKVVGVGLVSTKVSGVSISILQDTSIDFNGAAIGGSPNAGLSYTSSLGLLTSQLGMGINTAAANFPVISGGSPGNYVEFNVHGSDTDIGFDFITKGAGEFVFVTGTLGAPAVVFNQVGAATFNGATLQVGSGYRNQITIEGNTTGNPAVVAASGADTDVGLEFVTQGAGVITAAANTKVTGTLTVGTGNTNQMEINGGNGSTVQLVAQGGATDVTIQLVPKGGGSTDIASGNLIIETGNIQCDTYASKSAGPALVEGQTANGGSAVGVILNNTNSFSTAGSKLLSVRNANVEKRAIDKDGRDSVYGAVATAGNGMPAIVSYVELLGNTTDGASLTSFSPAADAVLEISGYINCTGYVSGSVSIQLSYTDVHSATQAIGNMGGQSTAGIFQTFLAGTGSLAIFPQLIKVKGGSTVTLIARTGAGLDTADFIGVIKQIA